MRAVIPEVPPDIHAWRQRTGTAMWDERREGMWDMAPLPNREHQALEGAMETSLAPWLR